MHKVLVYRAKLDQIWSLYESYFNCFISHFRDHTVAALLKDIQFECGSFR